MAVTRESNDCTVIDEKTFNSIKQIRNYHSKAILTGLGIVEGRMYTLHKCEELIIENCSMELIMTLKKYFTFNTFIKKLTISNPAGRFESTTPNTLYFVGTLVFIDTDQKQIDLIQRHIKSNMSLIWTTTNQS